MSIVLENLVKRYGTTMVVDHVNLEIQDGELFVLLGASGSGKSTILRMIAGLVDADDGRILLHNRDVTHLPPQQRNTGFVFQNYSLFRHMTVADNIEFGLAIRKVPKGERATKRDELLQMIGLAGLGGRYPRQLSGGQQQRVAVARALAFEPAVLLLDEPFGALDAKIRVQLRQSLKAIQRKLGVTTILVTHDQEEAFELADRIGVVDHGRLLEVGAPTELYRRPKHEFVARFLGGANLLAGQQEREQVNVGPVRLPTPGPRSVPDGDGQATVLFRPEDLTLAAERARLDGPVLGQGVVEEVLFLGTLQRVQVRLQALPGTWPLSNEYGEAGVALNVALLSRGAGVADFEVGQRVWVGVKDYHLLPRPPLRLLLCTDDATNGITSSRFVAKLAHATGGPVTVVAISEERDVAERMSGMARHRLLPRLPSLRSKVRRGHPVTEIVREVEAGDYDLVVVGAGGKHGGHDGSEETAALIARHCPIPVLVVKGDRPALRRILLCTAGGEPGKLDVLFGTRIARRSGAESTLLYVDTSAQAEAQHAAAGRGTTVAVAPRPRALIERHLEAGVQTLLNQGVHAELKVRQGAVPDEILAEAAEGDYDLIVVGGHLPRSSLRFLDHDLATEVVTRADRPVLVVRGTFNQ